MDTSVPLFFLLSTISKTASSVECFFSIFLVSNAFMYFFCDYGLILFQT